MNKEPETYEELIRKKRCIELARYYELTEEEFVGESLTALKV